MLAKRPPYASATGWDNRILDEGR